METCRLIRSPTRKDKCATEAHSKLVDDATAGAEDAASGRDLSHGASTDTFNMCDGYHKVQARHFTLQYCPMSLRETQLSCCGTARLT